MKRIQIILCLSILASSILLGQSCLPGTTIFSTQGQIDSFAINHPGCTQVLGNVGIQESIPGTITNLNGFNPITEIDGFFNVFCNESLPNLSGLENVTLISGGIDITKNPSLNSLSALSNITEHFGLVAIINNASLVNLNGFENVEIAHGTVHIASNSNLTDISALSSLEYVANSLELVGLTALTDLTGLSSLDSVGFDLFIKGNYELENLEGLNNLKSTGRLEILGNFALNDITALSNLKSLKGELYIQNNFTLPSLSGLDNLDPNSLDFLFIQTCNNLSYCHVQSICDYLDAGGDHFIEFNENGCQSSEEILSWCDSIGTAVMDLSHYVKLYPNPTSFNIQIVSESNLNVRYELSDATGQLLQKGIGNTIDLSVYTNGVYFVKLSANEQTWVERIVKK